MSADKKISQLTDAGALTGAELLAIVQGGATVKTDINTLLAFILTGEISGSGVADKVAIWSSASAITSSTLKFSYGILGTIDSLDADLGFSAKNTSSGTSARANVTLDNGTDKVVFNQYGSSFTTAGLLIAGLSSIETTSTAGLLHNIGGGGSYYWCINTTATSVMKLTATLLKLTGVTVWLSAGTTSVVPLLFQSGTNLTTALAGGIEYDGTNFFATRTGTTRETLMTGATTSAPSTSNIGVILDYYGSSSTRVLTTPTGWIGFQDGATLKKIPYYT